MFYWVVKMIAWPLRVVYFRGEIQGLENFPRSGPAILIANHVSFLDAGLLGSLLPRKVHFMVLSKHYHLRRIHWFYWGMDTIPVQIGRPDHGSIRRALKLLGQGKVLGIFPEGKRSPDGRLRDPLPGAAMIAAKSGVPIVPAAICGAYEAFPMGSVWPTPSKIRVRIGRPFKSGAAGQRPGREELRELSERMMREIGALQQIDAAGAARGDARQAS